MHKSAPGCAPVAARWVPVIPPATVAIGDAGQAGASDAVLAAATGGHRRAWPLRTPVATARRHRKLAAAAAGCHGLAVLLTRKEPSKINTRTVTQSMLRAALQKCGRVGHSAPCQCCCSCLATRAVAACLCQHVILQQCTWQLPLPQRLQARCLH